MTLMHGAAIGRFEYVNAIVELQPHSLVGFSPQDYRLDLTPIPSGYRSSYSSEGVSSTTRTMRAVCMACYTLYDVAVLRPVGLRRVCHRCWDKLKDASGNVPLQAVLEAGSLAQHLAARQQEELFERGEMACYE